LRPLMIWTDGQWRSSDDSAIKEVGSSNSAVPLIVVLEIDLRFQLSVWRYMIFKVSGAQRLRLNSLLVLWFSFSCK
jgi:hypothetical protein